MPQGRVVVQSGHHQRPLYSAWIGASVPDAAVVLRAQTDAALITVFVG